MENVAFGALPPQLNYDRGIDIFVNRISRVKASEGKGSGIRIEFTVVF